MIDRVRSLAVVALAGGLLSVAACGGGDGGAAAAPKTSAPTTGASKTGTPADPRAAFRQCLQQHGVTLPSRPRPGATDRPTGRATGGPTGRPTGRPRGPLGGLPSLSAGQRQAFQACASLAPGGFAGGFGGGVDQSALKAFQSCMSQHGVKMANAFRPGASRTADPKFAAAFRTCRALLPRRSPRPATPAPAQAPAPGSS
ncbi:MAG TPA: hypothetical protein VF069_07470 [Streptosporangiaceae bacterium]